MGRKPTCPKDTSSISYSSPLGCYPGPQSTYSQTHPATYIPFIDSSRFGWPGTYTDTHEAVSFIQIISTTGTSLSP